MLPVIDLVLIQKHDQRREGSEKNNSKFTAFHGSRGYCPGSSGRLRKHSGALIHLIPPLQDLLGDFCAGVFKQTFDDSFGQSFFAQVELLRWNVPNDGEVLTYFVQRTETRDSRVAVGRITQVPMYEKVSKTKVSSLIPWYTHIAASFMSSSFLIAPVRVLIGQ